MKIERCRSCGRSDFIDAVDNHGHRYRGCKWCVIVDPRTVPGAGQGGAVMWLIEFRNGFYFQSLTDEHSGPAETAQKFATMYEVDSFVTDHEWILFNGGCPVEVCAHCLRTLDYREQPCCTKRKSAP